MNLYATLDDLKAETNRKGSSDDTALLRILERVSRSLDEEIGYPFHATVATRYFDGNGRRDLWLPTPHGILNSVTTLKVDNDDDGVFETTLTEGTDFRLWPVNRSNAPAWKLEVLTRSAELGWWPRGQSTIEIAGIFGYSYEVETAGTLGAALDSSATSATLSAGHSVRVGRTLKVDSEQLYVSAVAGNSITVSRGVNGTTAAAHDNGATVSARRYPADIEAATLMQAARFAREMQTGYSGAAGGEEFSVGFNALYPAIRDMIRHFKSWNVP